MYQLCLNQIHDHTEIADSIYPTFLKYVNINSSASDMLKNYPPTTQGQWKCPPLVGGPAAVADALTHHSGAVKVPPPGGWTCCNGGRTHPPGGGLPPPMGGGCPCTVGRVQFPHRYKPRSVLPPQHIAETSALVTKTLVQYLW